MEELAPQFWRREAKYGFMERPDVPAQLRSSRALGCTVDIAEIIASVTKRRAPPVRHIAI